jgi:hypothetical protein
VDGGNQRLAGDSGIAVRDCDRYLFMKAEHQIWLACAFVIHQGIVKAAKAGARI